MSQIPVFHTVSGSTSGPGVLGTIFHDRAACSYDVFTVPKGKLFVMEYVSAIVTRGLDPYPAGNLNEYGAVGYKLNGAENLHFIPFSRSESSTPGPGSEPGEMPMGLLMASQALQLYVPANAIIFVKVPIPQDPTGGATVQVSGYYINA